MLERLGCACVLGEELAAEPGDERGVLLKGRPATERAVTSRDSIRFGDTVIEYEVRRSVRRKKTVQITVDGGAVRVAAPSTTPKREIQEFVQKKAPWIVGHMATAAVEAAPKKLVSGETLPYLGRDVRMVVEFAYLGAPEVRFDHRRLRVAVPGGLDDGERHEEIQRAVVAWYRTRAAEQLAAGVDRWWSRLGKGEKSRILIRDHRSYWGSCSHDGTLRFNWRVVMLEPALIEYLVVHELAHLEVRNHSADFWNLVARFLPDAKQRRRRLREAGRALPF